MEVNGSCRYDRRYRPRTYFFAATKDGFVTRKVCQTWPKPVYILKRFSQAIEMAQRWPGLCHFAPKFRFFDIAQLIRGD